MESKKAVLVTGATGFIGRHLARALTEKGHTVYPCSRSTGNDICREGALDTFLDKEIHMVVHLAGEIFVPESWQEASRFYETNVIGTQHVLDFCKEVNARLVYVSGYLYGVPRYLPIDENHPITPNNPYAHSKWLGEELCRFYVRTAGARVVILRPFNIYGIGQRDIFLIPTILKQLKERGKIEVKDDSPKRDYLYISDFIEACELAVNYEGPFNIFNLGSGVSLSVKDIIATVIACYGKHAQWASLGEKRRNEIPETVADCRRIKDALGWKPKVAFRDGIGEILKLSFLSERCAA